MPTCSHHRPPPAVTIRSAEDALKPILIVADSGRKECAVLACLDAARRPLTLFVVDDGDGTDRPGHSTDDPCTCRDADLLLQALDCLVLATARAGAEIDSVVLALSRPGRGAIPDPADAEAFRHFEARCVDGGLLLLDWFIVADGEVRSVATHVGRLPAW